MRDLGGGGRRQPTPAEQALYELALATTQSTTGGFPTAWGPTGGFDDDDRGRPGQGILDHAPRPPGAGPGGRTVIPGRPGSDRRESVPFLPRYTVPRDAPQGVVAHALNLLLGAPWAAVDRLTRGVPDHGFHEFDPAVYGPEAERWARRAEQRQPRAGGQRRR